MARLNRLLRSIDGSAIMEFALVAPIMLMLTGGIVEFGLAFRVYNAVNRLASQYAAAWADCSDYPTGTCLTELGSYTSSSSIGNVVPQLTASRLSLTMFEVRMTGTTPVVVYAYPAAGTLTAGQTTAARAAFSDGQSGVVVTASYSHTLAFFQSVVGSFLAPYLTPAYTVTQLKS